MSKLKFGIELEFHVERLQHADVLAMLRHNFDCSFKTYSSEDEWSLGVDGTASKGIWGGLELRTPVFQHSIPKRLFEIINYLKEIGGGVTKESGIHIHFSGINLGGFDRLKLEDYLRKLNLPGKIRHKFCMSASERSKYKTIRIVGVDHYECRAFNSTLNPRAINAYFNMLVKAIEMAKQENV